MRLKIGDREAMSDLSGRWTGAITGTNSGSLALRIDDRGGALDGTVQVADTRFGLTEFVFVGQRVQQQFELRITPTNSPEDVVSGAGRVSGTLRSDGTLTGVWETEIGTAGTFMASRESDQIKSQLPSSGQPKRSSMTPLWVISLFVSLCELVAGLAVTQATGGVQIALTAFVIQAAYPKRLHPSFAHRSLTPRPS